MPALPRRTIRNAVAVTGILSLTALAPPASALPAAPSYGAPPTQAAVVAGDRDAKVRALQQRLVRQVRGGRPGPHGPNPVLSLVPDSARQDWGGWRQATRSRALEAKSERRAAAVEPANPLVVREDEPRGTRGGNDTLASAQLVGGFGTTAGRNPAAGVRGRLSPAQLAPGSVQAIPAGKEDNGTFAKAIDTGISAKRAGITTTGRIGDAATPDDADFYKMTLRAGQMVDVTMRRTSGRLEPTMFLVDGQGNFVDFSDEEFGSDTSTLATTVRTAGDYYLIASAWTTIYLDTGEVVRPDGAYSMRITARAGDRDVYAVQARAGDVLGVSVGDAAGYVSVFDSAGTEVHGSGQDASYIYPEQNPLPGGGAAATDHVVRRSGTHYVEITSGDGVYEAELEVYRYGGAARRQTQTIFLDMDGQRLNTGIFYGRGVTRLSPMRSFLGRWGLPRSAEKGLTERIRATVQENLVADLRKAGLSNSVDVRVVTSMESPELYGRPGVTRVIVGGTIEESGVYTIGIAQSIDPGNYDREETGLLLLDSLSEPGNKQEAPYSLNSYIGRGSNRAAFIGRALGNVVSHEVGHMIGNWHVDETNAQANIMDAGGNFPLLFGVGRDGLGGTADDPDVDLGPDRFNIWEGFTGIEDTLSRSVWAMSSRARTTPAGVRR